jgi:hypothetical protein
LKFAFWVANNSTAWPAIAVSPNDRLVASYKTTVLCCPKNEMRATLLEKARTLLEKRGPSIPVDVNGE